MNGYPSSVSGSFSLRHSLVVVACLTVVLRLLGWMTTWEMLPINPDLERAPLHSETARFIRWWLRSALIVGVALPVLAFLIGIRRRDLRQAFGLYLLVLAGQIATEMMMRRTFFSSMLVLIGTAYTAYRLWQLWQGIRLVRSSNQVSNVGRRLALSLLWLLFAFWGINLTVILVFIEWPRLFVH